MRRQPRKETDAFNGGMCAALSVVRLHGNDVVYEEIADLGGYSLLSFAVRNKDVETPHIRRALRECLRRQKVRQKYAAAAKQPREDQ
jgi:hypothetical protein